MFKSFPQTSIPPLISLFCGKEGLSPFFVDLLCLIVPKNFKGEPFGDSEKFGYRKFLCIRGWYYEFPSKFVCLTVPKQTYCRGTVLCFGKYLVLKNFMNKRKGITISRRILFVLSTETFCRGNLLYFAKLLVSKNFHAIWRGGV